MADTAFTEASYAVYRCPTCVRHFMAGRAVEIYDGFCNVCDAAIDPGEDRIQ